MWYMGERPTSFPERPEQFDRFTNRARRVVLELAQEEAKRFSSPYVEPEHILLGLVREGDDKDGGGLAAKVLANLGVDSARIRTVVEGLIAAPSTQGGSNETPERLPMNFYTKMAIQFAVEEARGLNHHYIGTEHLLLGLARLAESSEATTVGVFKELDLAFERIREESIRILSQPLVRRSSFSLTPEQELANNAFLVLSEWRSLLNNPNISQERRNKILWQLEDLLKKAKEEGSTN